MNTEKANKKSKPAMLGVATVAGLAIVMMLVLAYTNRSVLDSDLSNHSLSTEIDDAQPVTIQITPEEALARYGEEANRARALNEAAGTLRSEAAQLVFLDEDGNRVAGRAEDIPGILPRQSPTGPVVTWPGNGTGGGIVADTSGFRTYTIVAKKDNGQLEKDFVTGTREDAARVLNMKRVVNETKADKSIAPELKEHK